MRVNSVGFCCWVGVVWVGDGFFALPPFWTFAAAYGALTVADTICYCVGVTKFWGFDWLSWYICCIICHIYIISALSVPALATLRPWYFAPIWGYGWTGTKGWGLLLLVSFIIDFEVFVSPFGLPIGFLFSFEAAIFFIFLSFKWMPCLPIVLLIVKSGFETLSLSLSAL